MDPMKIRYAGHCHSWKFRMDSYKWKGVDLWMLLFGCLSESLIRYARKVQFGCNAPQVQQLPSEAPPPRKMEDSGV